MTDFCEHNNGNSGVIQHGCKFKTITKLYARQFEYNSRVSEWGTETIRQLEHYNTR